MLDSLFKKNNEKTTPINFIDIGCRWGFAEKFIKPAYQNILKIYGFDPDLDECKRLEESYAHLPTGFVNCIPVALGEFSGDRNLYITKEPACSSLHPPRKYLSDNYPSLDCITLNEVVSVSVISISQWAMAQNVKSLDYIKIDTQGSELEILRGAGDLLKTTRCIDIEVEFNPLYEGQSLFCDVDTFMRSRGFMLWKFSNLVHYSQNRNPVELPDSNTVCFDVGVRQESKAYGGQLFWADARYVKSDVFIGPKDSTNNSQRERDILIFDALGMIDVTMQLQGIRE